MCLKHYELDTCYYFGSPGLTWDETLRMASVELELISDTDMYLFVEKEMRGGISYTAKTYQQNQ